MMTAAEKRAERMYVTPPDDAAGHDDPRQMVYVYEDEIFVDSNMQRSTEPGRLESLGEHDWDKAETVTVRERAGGQLVAVEGQNRVLLLRKDFPGSRLWAVMIENPDEAGVALGIARSRRGHSPYEVWQLRLHRGEERETLAEVVLKDLGLELSKARTRTPGRIAAVGSLRQIMQYGTPQEAADLLRRTLSVIGMSFGEQDQMWEAPLLRAVAVVLRSNPEIDMAHLTRVLRAMSPEGWLRETASARKGRPASACIGEAIVRDYNKGKPVDSPKRIAW